MKTFCFRPFVGLVLCELLATGSAVMAQGFEPTRLPQDSASVAAIGTIAPRRILNADSPPALFGAPADPYGLRVTGYQSLEPASSESYYAGIADDVVSPAARELGPPANDYELSPSDVVYLPEAEPEAPCCLDHRPYPWIHRTSIYGDFLYIRPRNAEVSYAVPINGAIAPPPAVPIQVGRVATIDQDYQPAFRVGGWYALDDCNSIGTSFTRLKSNTRDATTVTAPIALRGLTLHPGATNAAANFLDASAIMDIDFDLVDADFRSAFWTDDLYAVNYILGARYARFDQTFQGIYTGAGSTETVNTDVCFDGAGIRLGLDAERHTCCKGLMLYARGTTNFLAGEVRGRYTHASTFDPIVADTEWRAGRIVTVLDIELGVGWQSFCGHYRLTAGYYTSVWYNGVATNNWIQSVQTNNFTGLSDLITFDGLMARAEYRF